MPCTHVVWIGEGKARSIFSIPRPCRLYSVLPGVIPRTDPLSGMSYGAVISTLVSVMFGISYYLWLYSDTTKYHKYQMRGAWERSKYKWCSFDKNKYPYSFTGWKKFLLKLLEKSQSRIFLLSIFSFNNESQRRTALQGKAFRRIHRDWSCDTECYWWNLGQAVRYVSVLWMLESLALGWALCWPLVTCNCAQQILCK